MKQYKLMQVALLAILLFGWAGCSQNEEEVPGNVRNGIVLNVTDTGIISNEPSTRTEDTGFVTTFTQGDQIGLFAVKDGAILDEIIICLSLSMVRAGRVNRYCMMIVWWE